MNRLTNLILLLTVSLTLSCTRSKDEEKNDVSSSLSENDLVSFKIPTVQGEIVTFKAGNSKTVFDHPKFKNKILIIDFWATWCAPFIREIPHFREIYRTYKDKGVEIIGIALDAAGERVVRPFVEEYQIEYTTLIAVPPDIPDGMEDYPYIPLTLNIREIVYGPMPYIPTTFFVDRIGNIRNKFEGYHELSDFEAVINELL